MRAAITENMAAKQPDRASSRQPREDDDMWWLLLVLAKFTDFLHYVSYSMYSAWMFNSRHIFLFSDYCVVTPKHSFLSFLITFEQRSTEITLAFFGPGKLVPQ